MTRIRAPILLVHCSVVHGCGVFFPCLVWVLHGNVAGIKLVGRGMKAGLLEPPYLVMILCFIFVDCLHHISDYSRQLCISPFFFVLLDRFLFLYVGSCLFAVSLSFAKCLLSWNIRRRGLQDSMPTSTFRIQTIFVKHCIVLLRGCVTQSFQFVLIQSLLCVLLLKLAKVVSLLLSKKDILVSSTLARNMQCYGFILSC